ncbi:MAG: hypothetical protein N4A50_15200 [Vallitalea sp.]|jgi:ABC-type transporter MlaC component|nr:hypothetical protein [Vallitalea sp.]
MKKIKKLLIVSVFTFLVINTIAYAADIDIYSGIISRITAVKDTIVNRNSGLSKDTDAAIKKLDNYIKDYEANVKSELEKYKQTKKNESKQTIDGEVNKVIDKLNSEKPKLLDEYKKEIDTSMQQELEKELERLRKKYSNN